MYMGREWWPREAPSRRQGRHYDRRRSQRGRRVERLVVVVTAGAAFDGRVHVVAEDRESLIPASSSALVGVIRDGDDGVLRSGASCPIRVGLLISCSRRSSLARSTARCQWPDLSNGSLDDLDGFSTSGEYCDNEGISEIKACLKLMHRAVV